MKAIKKLFKILRLLTICCMEKPPIVMLHTALGRFFGNFICYDFLDRPAVDAVHRLPYVQGHELLYEYTNRSINSNLRIWFCQISTLQSISISWDMKIATIMFTTEVPKAIYGCCTKTKHATAKLTGVSANCVLSEYDCGSKMLSRLE